MALGEWKNGLSQDPYLGHWRTKHLASTNDDNDMLPINYCGLLYCLICRLRNYAAVRIMVFLQILCHFSYFTIILSGFRVKSCPEFRHVARIFSRDPGRLLASGD